MLQLEFGGIYSPPIIILTELFIKNLQILYPQFLIQVSMHVDISSKPLRWIVHLYETTTFYVQMKKMGDIDTTHNAL